MAADVFLRPFAEQPDDVLLWPFTASVSGGQVINVTGGAVATMLGGAEERSLDILVLGGSQAVLDASASKLLEIGRLGGAVVGAKAGSERLIEVVRDGGGVAGLRGGGPGGAGGEVFVTGGATARLLGGGTGVLSVRLFGPFGVEVLSPFAAALLLPLDARSDLLALKASVRAVGDTARIIALSPLAAIRLLSGDAIAATADDDAGVTVAADGLVQVNGKTEVRMDEE